MQKVAMTYTMKAVGEYNIIFVIDWQTYTTTKWFKYQGGYIFRNCFSMAAVAQSVKRPGLKSLKRGATELS